MIAAPCGHPEAEPVFVGFWTCKRAGCDGSGKQPEKTSPALEDTQRILLCPVCGIRVIRSQPIARRTYNVCTGCGTGWYTP